MATIDVKDAAGATVAIEKPLTPGTAADSASRPVAFSTEGKAQLGALTETAPATDTASSGLNGRLQRLAQRLTTLLAVFPTTIDTNSGNKSASTLRTVIATDQPNLTTPLNVAGTATEVHLGSVTGHNFSVPVTPTVTNGAYSAGDIVGGLIEPVIGRVASGWVTLQSISIALKAAVTSNLTVYIYSADPSSTTKTDNAAYSLNAADAFKVRYTVTNFVLSDHGTPNTYQKDNLGLILQTDASQKIQCLIVDGTGLTLTSTSDLQITFIGYAD